MSRVLVLGDVHGNRKALDQVLERSMFNNEKDKLIFLGDVADGWPETKACIDRLLEINNLIHLLGNHDDWFRQWVRTGWKQPIWTGQGGNATLESYNFDRRNVPPEHAKYLEDAKYYHIDGENRLYVHAGIESSHPMHDTDHSLIWSRRLWREAQYKTIYGDNNCSLTDFDEVFIGHTQTKQNKPVNCCEIWNVDQGAGWKGKLTIMDVDSKNYWQSDPVKELYPDFEGRG